MPQLINYSLDLLNFPRGILVFLPGLVFFLGSTEQYKAMKLELHFSDQKWIYGAFPKFYQFSGHFLNLGWKKALPGTRGALAECPGGLSVRGSRAGGTRRVPGGVLGARLTRRAPGRGSRGSATRDTWPAREHPGSSPGWVLGNTCRTRRASGCGLRVRHSGTGGILGDIRRKSLAGHSGTSGRILSVGVLGTRVALASFRVKYLSLGFTAHSGASGRLAAHSETRVVLRRRFRKGFRRVASGMVFGTPGILRKVLKGGPS